MIRWRARSGVSSQETYEALVRTASVPLIRHAERLYEDQRDAEDAVADAFEQAWRMIHAGTTVNLGWLIDCMDDRRRDRDARERTRQAAADSLVEAVSDSAIAADDDDRTHIDLDRLLSMLAADDRKLIELLDLDGYSTDELATLLSINRATVRKRHARARRRLRALLAAANIGLKAGEDHVA